MAIQEKSLNALRLAYTWAGALLLLFTLNMYLYRVIGKAPLGPILHDQMTSAIALALPVVALTCLFLLWVVSAHSKAAYGKPWMLRLPPIARDDAAGDPEDDFARKLRVVAFSGFILLPLTEASLMLVHLTEHAQVVDRNVEGSPRTRFWDPRESTPANDIRYENPKASPSCTVPQPTTGDRDCGVTFFPQFVPVAYTAVIATGWIWVFLIITVLVARAKNMRNLFDTWTHRLP